MQTAALGQGLGREIKRHCVQRRCRIYSGVSLLLDTYRRDLCFFGVASEVPKNRPYVLDLPDIVPTIHHHTRLHMYLREYAANSQALVHVMRRECNAAVKHIRRQLARLQRHQRLFLRFTDTFFFFIDAEGFRFTDTFFIFIDAEGQCPRSSSTWRAAAC